MYKVPLSLLGNCVLCPMYYNYIIVCDYYAIDAKLKGLQYMNSETKKESTQQSSREIYISEWFFYSREDIILMISSIVFPILRIILFYSPL